MRTLLLRRTVFLGAWLLVLFGTVMVAQAEESKISYGGGDGSSFEKAVVIKGATEETGVKAEYAYLREHFSGYTMGKQSLVNHEKRVYDVLDITTKDGAAKSVYFDITGFFGKF